MLKNYFKIALRSMARQRLFTFVNLLGLSLAMAVCLLLITIIYDHKTYDTFHSDADRIYRIISKNGVRSSMFDGVATSPLPFKAEIESNYPFIEAATNLRHDFRGEAQSATKVLHIKGYYTDPGFFKVFSYELEEGNEETAFNAPFNVVLTRETAEKFFGKKESYLGEVLEVTGRGPFKVAGIIKVPEIKSHFDFEALASISTIKELGNAGVSEEWTHLWTGYNYFKLRPGTNPEEVNLAINDIATKNITWPEDRDWYRFEVQNILDISTGMRYSNEMGFFLPNIILYFFGFLCLVVMVTALFNYTNLSLAKSLSRAREVGVRKTSGASRGQIIQQFVMESVIMALVALAIAIGVLNLILPAFNGLEIFSKLGVGFGFTWTALPYFVLFALVVGIIAGIFPAIFLSKFQPVKALKGYHAVSFDASKARRGFLAGFSAKRLLLTIQFGLSLFMIISILLLREQTKLLVQTDYGFNEENVFFVELQGNKPELVAASLSTHHSVVSHTFASHNPAVGIQYGAEVQRNMEGERFGVSYFSVAQGYIHTLGIPLLAGNDFPESAGTGEEKFILINEAALKSLGYETPHEAVGEELILDKEKRMVIQGVVKNYNFTPLLQEVGPMVLRVLPNDYQLLTLKLATTDLNGAIEEMEAKWAELDPRRDFKYGFLDKEMDYFYFFLNDITAIITTVSIFAVFISCLGLLGMVSFQLQTKMKEISIRRVLGASAGQLAVSLTRQYSKVILAAIVVFVPIAIVVSNLWLNLLAYRVPIGPGLIASALAIVVLLGLATIVSQVVKAASANPVNALRNE